MSKRKHKVIGYISLLQLALPLTFTNANEGYFLWCHSSWSLKAEGYLNLLLTHSQYSAVPGDHSTKEDKTTAELYLHSTVHSILKGEVNLGVGG